MEIRIFSIRFAKRNAEEKRDMEFELLQKLQDLNARIVEIGIASCRERV